MIGVQNEENVQGVLERGIGPVFQFRGLEEHVEEIAGIAQLVVGIGKGHSEAVAIGEGGERGHFANQAIGLLAAGFGVEDIARVRVEGGERGNGGDQHAHGVGVVMKAVEKFLDAFVNEGVMRDVVGPIL